MGLTATDYLAQLQALLPPGPAWPRDADAVLTKMLAAWGDSLARIDARALDLVDEALPISTSELLADWERVAGLPDACTLAMVGEQTEGQRQAALTAKLTSVGGQTPAYYVAIAAALGYTITITEFTPHDVTDSVDAPIYGDTWAYAFQVNAAATTVDDFTVADTVADALSTWGNASLECVINKLKPAHTAVLYLYT